MYWLLVFLLFLLFIFFWFRLLVLVLVHICRWCRSVMFLFVDGEGAIYCYLSTTISRCYMRWCGHLVLVARAWGCHRLVCLLYCKCYIYLGTNLSIVFCMNSVKFQVGIFKFIQVIEESLCFYLSMVTRCFVYICRWCKRRYVSGSACSCWILIYMGTDFGV